MDEWLAKPMSKNPREYGIEININVVLLPSMVKHGPAASAPTREANGGMLPANFIKQKL